MLDPRLAAIVLFALSYILMLTFSKHRPLIALAAGVMFVATGMLPLGSVLDALDFNALLILAGMMGLTHLFAGTKAPALAAEVLLDHARSLRWATVVLCLLAGILSAFVYNVAVVLLICPVAMAACKKRGVRPVGMVLAISVSANLQSAATFVSDTAATVLGSGAGLGFADFFWYQGKPSLFFAVELGGLVCALVLIFLTRREKAAISLEGQRTRITDPVPGILLLLALLGLACAGLVPGLPRIFGGIFCCALLIFGVVHNFWKQRKLEALLEPLLTIDWSTLGMLVGLFLMVGGLKHRNVIGSLAEFLADVTGGNLFGLYTCVVLGSLVICALVDKLPYVAAMLPVMGALAQQLAPALGADAAAVGIPLYFGLLVGAALGSNLTPIGAQANTAAIDLLHQEGCEIKHGDFFRIGIPFTLAALLPAYLYIWLVFRV